MAKSGRRREAILPTPPNFFKIILDPPAETLTIPIEFKKRHGQNLPNRVFLKVPSGSVLEVELVQSNGETLLQKGWKEFKERYSIDFGHFLVFEYNGDSQFDVLIFDKSASEISYPVDADFEANQAPNAEDNGTESGSEDSLVVLNNPYVKQQNRRKRRLCEDSIGCSSPTYHAKRVHSRVKGEELTSEGCSDCDIGRQCLDKARKQRALAKETSVAYQKAIAFTRAHSFRSPFCISLMQPSYVSYRFRLNVPFAFAKENLPCQKTNFTILLANGKAWSVICVIRKASAKMQKGWKEFALDNALKAGDVCIFEVAEKIKPVWNVIIFRS